MAEQDVSQKMKISYPSALIIILGFVCSQVRAEPSELDIDLGKRDSIEHLADEVKSSKDVSVSCISGELKKGYVAAVKIRRSGAIYVLHLSGQAKSKYITSKMTVRTIKNYKLTKRLEFQIEGFNLYMMSVFHQNKEALNQKLEIKKEANKTLHTNP